MKRQKVATKKVGEMVRSAKAAEKRLNVSSLRLSRPAHVGGSCHAIENVTSFPCSRPPPLSPANIQKIFLQRDTILYWISAS